MIVKLRDVCTIVSGTTPRSNCPEYWDGNINWITPAELTDDTDIIYETQRKITEKAVVESNLKAFPSGTVLLSSRAPIGKVAIAGTEMYCNQGFKNLICSELIYNRYLYYFLKNRKNYLNSLGRGATFKEVSKEIVGNVEIPLPSIEEQRNIVAIQDSISKLIAKKKQQLYEFDKLTKSRFIELFGSYERTEDLGTYATLITKGASPKWQGINYSEEGTLFITSENVKSGYIDFGKRKYLDNKINKILPRSVLHRNDILINIVGASIGRAAIFESDELANINQAVSLVRIDKSKLDLKFLITYLNSPQVMKLYNEMKKGVARDNLSLKNIADIPIPVVNMKLQRSFSSFAEQVDKSKLAIQKSIEKLEILKESLMQKYFN